MAIANDIQYLRETPERLREILLDYRARIRRIEFDASLSTAGKNERIAAERAAAMRQIDDEEAEARDAKARIQAAVDRTFAQDDRDATAALLREFREWRAWQRVRPVLEQTEPSMLLTRLRQLLQRASEQGDVTTFWACDQELPSFLEVAGQAAMTDQALAILRDAWLPHMSQQQREALAAAKELAENWPSIVMAFRMARQEAGGDSAAIRALPGWRGEAIAVA